MFRYLIPIHVKPLKWSSMVSSIQSKLSILKHHSPSIPLAASFSSSALRYDNNNVISYTNNSKMLQINESREKRMNMIKRNLPDGETDILSETLIKSQNLDNILELINLHHSVMNNRHLTQTFESLHDSIRLSHDPESSSTLLLSSPRFKMLCNRVIQRIRYFQTGEILTILKCLIYLKIQPQTMIVQSLLQMVRHHINDFSLDQIVFLDFLLDRQLHNVIDANRRRESSSQSHDDTTEDNVFFKQRQTIIPLMDALKLALPLVLQLKIESKELDFDDIDMVIKCLRMGTDRNIKDEVINKLMAAVSIKMKELSIEQAISVTASLSRIESPHPDMNMGLLERVLSQCMDAITAPGVTISDFGPQSVILNIVKRQNPYMEIYHKGMCDLSAKIAIENYKKVGIYKTLKLLWTLTKYDHVNYDLMEFIAGLIAEKDSLLIDDVRMSFTKILTAFSLPANYKPNKGNSDLVYETIIDSSSISYARAKVKYALFKIIKQFAILGYYPKEFINDCVQNLLDESIAVATNLGTRREVLSNVLHIYQGLCLEMNDQSGHIKENIELIKPYVNEYITLLSNEFKTNKPKMRNESINDYLIRGIGGEQFVANSIFTEYGHFIDNVVVMRKGDYPMSIVNDKSNITSLKDLTVPADSKIIGVVVLTNRDYCRTPFMLKGETDFKIRTMKKSGIIPLLVNIESWNSLLERERTPFLMREIQSVCKVQEQQQSNLS